MSQRLRCKDCENSEKYSYEEPCSTCYGYENFKKKKSMSNADKIRSMSDFELAEFLCGVFDDDECDGKYICGETIPHYDEDKIVEWLKSPTTD